ncbi:MAG: metal-sensing transcriptional repressor [Candidatus Pacebacteria bacterium]|nr:metal-sensing transcriptional repressor [Candidatus Paceibacterota bacterium]
MNEQKQKVIINFKKVQSLLDRLIKMTEKKEYCIDIMQQNLAAIGLLKSAHQMLLQSHLDTCFRKAMSTKNENRKKEMVDEILKVTKICNKFTK